MPINDLELSSIQNQKVTPREELVEDLAEKLIENRFVAVSGPEGSGKSTLVNELLLNQLSPNENKTEKDTFKWRITFTSPGASPISNLINSIKELKEGAGKIPPLFEKNSFVLNDALFSPENFRNNPDILSEIYHKAYGEIKKTFHWLIVIDQSQDLFRYRKFWNGAGGNAASQSAMVGDDVIYLNLILNARRSAVPIYIVFIFDYQYIEFYSRYRGIPEVINNSRVFVPPFTVKEVETFLKSKKFEADNDFIQVLKNDTDRINKEYDGYALLKLNVFLELFKLTPKKVEEAQKELKEAREKFDEAQKEVEGTPVLFIEQKKAAEKKVAEAQKKVDEAQKKADEAQEDATTPRALYQTIGKFPTGHPANCPPLQKIIAYYLEKELEIDLEKVNTEEKFFLQALTGLDSDNRPHRNPLKISDLLDLVNRPEPRIKPSEQPDSLKKKEEKPWDEDKIKALLDRFKYKALSFLKLPINDGKNDCIIDIKDKALLTSWPKLRRLIGKEAENAQLYRNLVRDAIQYHSNPREDLLYKDVSYANVLKWVEECIPNTTWCRRYVSEDLPEDSKDKGLKNFTLALDFFKASHYDFKSEIQKKEDEVKKAKKQVFRFKVLALLCLVFGIVTIWAILDIRKEKKKIEAREFINTLSFYAALKFSNDIYDQRDQQSAIRQLIDRGKIKLQDKVILDTLKARKYLSIGSENPDIINSSYQVLKTLKQLNTKFEKRGKDTLLSRYQQLNRLKPVQFRQFPAFYQALNAYYWQQAPYDEKEYPNIDPEALVVLKKYKGYCFGDREGKIHYVPEGRDENPIEAELSHPKFPISCLDFNAEFLFSGNYKGEIYELPLTKIMEPGLLAKDKLIYKTEDKNPIVLVKTLPGQPNSLFVVSSLSYFTLSKDSNGKWSKFKFLDKNAISPMVHYQWYAEEGLLFQIWGNSFFVHKVSTDKMEQIGTYTMKSSSSIITSIAIHQSNKNSTSYEVVIGDEKGNVWIGNGEAIYKNGQLAKMEFKGVEKFNNAHAAPITELAFNPDLPQFASADASGILKLWNLNTLYNNTPDFDDVYRRYNDKVNAISYLDKNRLVVYAGNNHFIEPTNIEYMYKYLKNHK